MDGAAAGGEGGGGKERGDQNGRKGTKQRWKENHSQNTILMYRHRSSMVQASKKTHVKSRIH